MRYREVQVVSGENGGAREPSEFFVTATVVMTLLIGALFTVVGYRAKQRWLTFWGTLTLAACGWFFIYTW